MRSVVISIIAVALIWRSVDSQCIQGLTVYNRTNALILGSSDCSGQMIDVKDLAEVPTITFSRSNTNDTYLLMFLEASQKSSDLFILHWLVSGIKPFGITLRTLLTSGTNDLTSGYFPPLNQTQYEFRLYNMTGKQIWGTFSASERLDFFPSQWLAKNGIHSAPLARTIFSVRTFIAGPPGWVVPPNPVGSYLPQYPVLPSHFPTPQQPAQPMIPGQPPQIPVEQSHDSQPSQYPTAQQPIIPGQSPQYPVGQQPPPHPVQPSQYPTAQQPVIPGQIPQYPVGQQQPGQPSQYPSQQIPPYPHQPIPPYPSQLPHPGQYPPTHDHHPVYPPHNPKTSFTVEKSFDINGTWFHIAVPNRISGNILIINSTLYTSDNYNKKFKLSPYMIINHTSYIWRNQTHIPGRGDFLYINSTLYVPYKPSNEVHHHYYRKGSATSLHPTTIFSILLVPLYLIFINNFN